VGEKTAKPLSEVQLGFSFFQDREASAAGPAAGTTSSPRAARSGGKPQSLADALVTTRALLLDVPLSELSTQLLPLFEFCEAALTRALDVVPTRSGVPFSAEEYRSLRGIGQAQWILTEEHGKREAKPAAKQERKTRKKMMSVRDAERGTRNDE